MDKGLVYLLQRGHEFKIGRTKNLKKRLPSIYTASAVRPKVIHIIESEKYVELENYLKRRFAANKLNGEWYSLNDAGVRCIRSITTWPMDGIDTEIVDAKEAQKHHCRVFQNELSFEYVVETDSIERPFAPTGVTLQKLLEERTKIRTPGDLRAKIGKEEMSRQQAWMLWHGKTSLGLRTAKRIAMATGIPLEELAEVDEAVPGKRRQPNQPPPDPRS